jgi:hypothetical protein
MQGRQEDDMASWGRRFAVIGTCAALLAAAPGGGLAAEHGTRAAPMAGAGGIRLRGTAGVMPSFYKLDTPYRWRWTGHNTYATQQ